MNRLEPKIHVVCLSAYKLGILHGAWINANQDADALYSAVQAMLANSPAYDAELFEIHDYQGFGSVNIGKHTSLDVISSLGFLIVYLHENGIMSYKSWHKQYRHGDFAERYNSYRN